MATYDCEVCGEVEMHEPAERPAGWTPVWRPAPYQGERANTFVVRWECGAHDEPEHDTHREEDAHEDHISANPQENPPPTLF